MLTLHDMPLETLTKNDIRYDIRMIYDEYL